METPLKIRVNRRGLARVLGAGAVLKTPEDKARVIDTQKDARGVSPAQRFHGADSKNWEEETRTAREVISLLKSGYGVAPAQFKPDPKKAKETGIKKYLSHRSRLTFVKTALLMLDGDEWSDACPAPESVSELLARFPTMRDDFCFLSESLSSRTEEKPELRFRCGVLLPDYLTGSERDMRAFEVLVLESLCERYPFVAPAVGKDLSRLGFGNARRGAIYTELPGRIPPERLAWARAKAEQLIKTEARAAVEKEERAAAARAARVQNAKRKGTSVSEDGYESDDPLAVFRETPIRHLLQAIGCSENGIASGDASEWHFPGASMKKSFLLFENGGMQIFSNTMQAAMPSGADPRINGHRFVCFYLFGYDYVNAGGEERVRLLRELAAAGYGQFKEKPKPRTGARLPVLVKEKTEGERQTGAVLSVVRAQLTENLRCWLREEGAHRRFLLLSHDTGVGKTYAVISETDALLMVSSHSDLTEEHYRTALDCGNEGFRWRGRAVGFQAVLDNLGLQWGGIPGRRRPELADACFELASDGRARAMCAQADVADVMARRGYHLGRDLCSLCAEIERCQQVAYLSQERAANASAQVFISYPELDILFDETRAKFVERLCSFYKDRTAVIDDCNPAQLSPRREVSLSLITALFKERTEDWVRDAQKSGTTVHFAPALSTAFLKDLQSLLQTGTNPNKAVSNLQDTYNLSDVREELSAIPIYIVVSDGQVEDARTGRVLDSDRFKSERVRDGIHRVFYQPREARRLRLVNDRDLPRVVDRESGFVAAMLENAPVRRKETGRVVAWEFLLQPHLTLKNTIALSATARAEDFRNVLGPTVDFKAIDGEPVAWEQGCKVYQLDRATYTERSYFERDGGEITGPGARLLDAGSLISKEARAGRKVLVVGRKALTSGAVSEVMKPVMNLPGVEIRNYGELVGVNEFSDFDTVFLMLPYPGREEIEVQASAVYREDFDALDLETRAAGTVRAGGLFSARYCAVFGQVCVLQLAQRFSNLDTPPKRCTCVY